MFGIFKKKNLFSETYHPENLKLMRNRMIYLLNYITCTYITYKYLMIIMSHEGRATYCFRFMSLVSLRFSVVNFETFLAFSLDLEPQNQFQPNLA